MQIGTMLRAPDGYMTLERGITYCFLRSNRVTGFVLLVVFSQTNPPKAVLTILPRREFEAGLTKKLIHEVPSTGLPPFLESLRGFNFKTLDQVRPNASKPLKQYIEERLLKITPLLQREEQILNAISPEREINFYAHTNGLNSQRIRLWFFTYLCFGRNIWTLIPLFFRAGRWECA